MTSRIAPVRLYDARRRRSVPLPRPSAGPVVVSAVSTEAAALTFDEARAALIADTLCRVLAWKGYDDVRRSEPAPVTPWGENGGCPAGAAHRVCVHVTATEGDESTAQPCHMLVNLVQRARFCRHLAHDWHRERRPPKLAELVGLGVSIEDLELGFLLAGHYRNPRKVNCSDLHGGVVFRDAHVVRRRWGNHLRALAPLPDIRLHREAAELLSPEGRDVLEAFDAAISDNMNAPRAMPLLYRALRLGELPRADRAVLAAVTLALVPALAAPAMSGT
ncbi:hypothetical protein LO772_33585 [Yinghuangia sp. ASG 101]|uniref:hypothetical protein n=1 Tax=Yinghuangia sp. ASG 101 TaxID=2896848 RepID=UPI001E33BDD2|nr:hypothetical protein [Yinghuangia sp. ASG 101]UGQ11652.1 hypothetical protein LO772_33585 [Yinghuangia sp. ASG 101]